MRINRKFQIERAASDDFTRPSIYRAQLDVAGKRAMATDGHILAIVPVEIEDGDDDGPIPDEALKAARKDTSKTFETVGLKLNGHAITERGASYPREKRAGQFPPVDQVVPKYRHGDAVKSDEPRAISFNAYLLMELAKAIGVDGKSGVITLTIAGRLDPIVIETSEEGAIGVLMPTRP